MSRYSYPYNRVLKEVCCLYYVRRFYDFSNIRICFACCDCLAQHPDKLYTTTKIAKLTKVPDPYLSKVLSTLTKHEVELLRKKDCMGVMH